MPFTFPTRLGPDDPPLEDELGLPGWIEPLAVGVITLFAVLGALQHPSELRFAAAAMVAVPYVLYRVGVPVPSLAGLALTVGAAFVVIGGNNDSLAVFALVGLCGSVATAGTLTESLGTLAASMGGLLANAAVAAPNYRYGWIPWSVGCAIGWGAGWLGRRQQLLVTQLRDAQAALAEQAANDERQRIAREIHDVIAHSLTVTMLHVTAARLALEDDRDEARVALTEAERLGRQSLADIRRTVGLLRPRGEREPPTEPLPSAADVPALVEDFRRTGLPVALRVDGDLGAVSTTTGLALYRIVQESLTNVAKHAPGAGVTVELDVAPDQVRVHVRNPSATAPPEAGEGGFGTIGMEQRATLLGGTLRAGPDGDGWSVEATLPCGAGTVAPSPG